MEQPEVITGEVCPICNSKTLTLMESHQEIPYFGKVYLFSMNCSNCKYHKADVEPEKKNEPTKYTLDVSSEDDLKIRIVKSADATVKISRIGDIKPGPASNGYVTNVEGIINRIKHQIETIRDNDDDKDNRKKAKNLLKKLQKVLWGREKIKIILEDPSGNSSIISEKAVKQKIRSK